MMDDMLEAEAHQNHAGEDGEKSHELDPRQQDEPLLDRSVRRGCIGRDERLRLRPHDQRAPENQRYPEQQRTQPGQAVARAEDGVERMEATEERATQKADQHDTSGDGANHFGGLLPEYPANLLLLSQWDVCQCWEEDKCGVER